MSGLRRHGRPPPLRNWSLLAERLGPHRRRPSACGRRHPRRDLARWFEAGGSVMKLGTRRSILLRSAQVAIDLLVLSASLWAALGLRFEGDVPLQMFKRVLFLWPYVVAFQYALLVVLGVPRYSWRYIGLREAVRIFGSLGASGVVLLGARLIVANIATPNGYGQYTHLPIGVVVFDMVLGFMGL